VSVDEYLRDAEQQMLPKMEGSAMVISIVAARPDIKQCLEIGAAILFDKPIILYVPKDRVVSANLRRIASAIVQGDDPSSDEKLKEAISNVLQNDARCR
jgi:hypothetical protein